MQKKSHMTLTLFCSSGYDYLNGDWDKIVSAWPIVLANIGNLSTCQVGPGGALGGGQSELVR